jgi:polysaccharide export outer membrane protein
VRTILAFALVLATGVTGTAQQTKPSPSTGAQAADSTASAAIPAGVTPPPDYSIGAEDVLSIVVWREKDLTAEVMVRPDGMVTLPLVNDVQAAGFTPERFRQELTKALEKYVESPNVTVIVKAINSRKVFITGEVTKPGPYALGGPTTVLQLIAQAGGLLEYADRENINVMRTVNGTVSMFRFNYKDVARGRKVEQNILLRPGDTVIVP